MIKIKGTDFYLIKEIEPQIRPNGQKRRIGLFKCKCGEEKTRDISRVGIKGITMCVNCSKEKSSERRKTHGLIKHPLYKKWADMKKRCYNKNADRYKSYGALGIRVCDDWKNNFQSFYVWCINNGWSENLTIDRKKVDGDYCPENCRFITMTEQGFNKKNTYYVKINKNTEVGLSELLYLNGKSDIYHTVWSGISKGKDIKYYIDKYNLKIDFKYISIKKI